MTITFYSNFLNPHQLELCLEMKKLFKKDFIFVATQPFNSSQVTKGFEDINFKYNFCLSSYSSQENFNKAIELLKTSDVVIIGSAPEKLLRIRMKTNKLTFRYSERAFKPLSGNRYNPISIACMFKGNTIYNKKPLYMLCASAYTAKDYRLIGAYKDKAYKWGYFPKGSDKSIDELLQLKSKNKVVRLVWAGRMINWKHGEIAIEIAKYLKDNNRKFELLMIGSGDKENDWKILSNKYKLENYVKFIGNVSNDCVVEYLESADIFLATSDKNEGWGAVVNEAMSSACVVVGCESMGSIPYLIKNDYNGIIFKEKDIKKSQIEVERLILNKDKRIKLSKLAKLEISNIWNAKIAVKNLKFLCESIISNSEFNIKEGPCSKA